MAHDFHEIKNGDFGMWAGNMPVGGLVEAWRGSESWLAFKGHQPVSDLP
jgi:hypothetical protein